MNIESCKNYVSRLNFRGTKLLDNFLFYGGKIAGRLIFLMQLILNFTKCTSQQSYYPESELKSKLRIFLEHLFYILRTGEIHKNYYIYGFDRKSKNDINEYVPWLTFTYARNTKNQRPATLEYNPYNFVCLLRDKFVFESFCKGTGINTPANIGMVCNEKLFLIKEDRYIALDEIVNLEIDGFCKRNISCGGGMATDIIKIEVKNNRISINNNIIQIKEFKNIFRKSTWVIQERIKKQNPEYANFHPGSINTIRIITVKYESEIEILSAALRMGVNDRFTDNWSSGGIIVGVNTDTGTLQKWGFFKPGFGNKNDRHPNSQIIFEGHKLPFWEEIVKYVKHAHCLFYGLHSIGWDVAITAEGIMIIEGNDNWNTVSTQLYKGAKSKFKKYFR